MEAKEQIRRAHYVEGKSIRQIGRELGYARKTIRKALSTGEESRYRLRKPRASPVLGAYQERIEELLAESDRQPRKQRYTAQKIYELICAEGYGGSQSSVSHYVAKLRKEKKRPKVYLPLEYDPGTDGQVDWGEAEVIMAGRAGDGAVICDALKLLAQAVCDGVSVAEARVVFCGTRARVSSVWGDPAAA